jgi:hypothetical protein
MELATLAATAGGTALNAKMQNDAIAEQNRQNQRALEMERVARAAEADRQMEFERQQAELVTQALFDAAPERIVEAGNKVAEAPQAPVNAAVDEFSADDMAGSVQNTDVRDTIGSIIAKKTAQTRELLRNAATLSGQFDGLAEAATSLGRMGSEIATIGSNRAGSIAASRMETSVPTPTVTRSSSPIGDLLILGGTAAGGMAGNKAGAAGTRSPFQIGSIFSRNRPLNAIPALGRVTI